MSTLQSGKTVSSRPKLIKCVVWDLDNTLWEGILLEDKRVELRADIQRIVSTLDQRGILQSIASKNDFTLAMAKLREFGLEEYFLYAQVNWNSKVASLQKIATALNLSYEALAFIDDDPFEREEVAFSLPDVLCVDASSLDALLTIPAMNSRSITEDSKMRRKMYLDDLQRKQAEELFIGSKEEFLSTLNLHLTIAPIKEDDLRRAEELTLRTNQLNTTGRLYSYEELDHFRQSPQHLVLGTHLVDMFGSYGQIGLVLIECTEQVWLIKLLLMSCRVLSKGIGTIVINYLLLLARKAQVKLRAEFIANGRNRMMYVTYKFTGFKEIETIDTLTILENDLSVVQPFPDYIKLTFEGLAID